MNKPNPQLLLEKGRKYRKLFETTTVNLGAYIINNSRYYIVTYSGKFSGKDKANAVISPDSNNKSEMIQALKPLINYFITINNIKDSIGKRAKLDYSLWIKIKDYIQAILESNRLTPDEQVVYRRSVNILNHMIELQKEMELLGKEVEEFERGIIEQGYFTEEDIDKAIKYIPLGGWIQYEQFKDRYKFREDFDLIFEKYKLPEFEAYKNMVSLKVMQHMTSKYAADQLKYTIDLMTDGKDMIHMSKNEYIESWLKEYYRRLEERYYKEKSKLRFPKD